MIDQKIIVGEVPIILSHAYQYIQKENEASEEYVKETENKIAWLVFNRPDKLNLFTQELAEELQSTLLNIEDDKEIRVLIITGAGEKQSGLAS